MKPIETGQRRVANIFDESAYTAYPDDFGDEKGNSYIKLNPGSARDIGFYIYRMGPGTRSTAHQHGGAEEFVVIEGALTDNDGTVYRAGDVVWLAPGTEHSSDSETGCIVAVFSEARELPPGS